MEKLKLICQKPGVSKVYDDGDYYTIKCENGQDFLYSKKENLGYPLAAVAKWDFEVVDEEYFKKLEKDYAAWIQEREKKAREQNKIFYEN